MIFLNEYGRLSQNIVYAGAAPGIFNYIIKLNIFIGYHIDYLSELFPTKLWYLIDPSAIKVKP
jgi:hypothetical protein